jgi:transcriptional regulator with XRE-family HTH domain
VQGNSQEPVPVTKRDTPRRRQFGAFLQEQMKARDLSIMDLARRAGVVHPMVVRWVQGENLPNPESCRRIAQALDIPHSAVLEMAGHTRAESGEDSGIAHFKQRVGAMVVKLTDDEREMVLTIVQSVAQAMTERRSRDELA